MLRGKTVVLMKVNIIVRRDWSGPGVRGRLTFCTKGFGSGDVRFVYLREESRFVSSQA